MKSFFLFAPNFRLLGADLAKSLASSTLRSVSGLVMGLTDLRPGIRKRLGEASGNLYSLRELEESWISTSCGPEDFKAFEERYGAGTFGRVITADRRLGAGYVTGGVQRPEQIGERRSPLSDSEREAYIVGLFKFLEREFERERPDVVFSYVVATAPALAMAIVAKRNGIQFATLSHTRIENRYLVDSEVDTGLSPVRRLLKSPEFKPQLDGYRAQARVLQEKWLQELSSPEYMDAESSSFQFGRLVMSIREGIYWLTRNSLGLGQPTQLRRQIFKVLTELRRFRAIRGMSKRFSLPDGPFLYFPLQVDPEASTMVVSPFLTNQLAVIEAISKSMPTGYRLVVKEHTPMLGLRPPGFYEQIEKFPRVVLASPRISTMKLIKLAQVTVVISGTAGWEAIRLGKPVLLVGEAPYSVIEGSIIRESDFTQFPSAIEAAIRLRLADTSEVVDYIAALLALSFPLDSTTLWSNGYRYMDSDEQAQVCLSLVKGIHHLVEHPL